MDPAVTVAVAGLNGSPLKYRVGIKKSTILSTLKEKYGPGRLRDSENFDIESSEDVVDAGKYLYAPDQPAGRKFDISRSWSEVMLLKELPRLPRDEEGLKGILFPNVNGRLPVTEQCYTTIQANHSEIVDDFLSVADGSIYVLQCHITWLKRSR